MAYVENALVHDADAHIMEEPDMLRRYAPAAWAERLPLIDVTHAMPAGKDVIGTARRHHADPDYRARDAAEIMNRKNWAATGSFLKADRPAALDLLGFASQLVFNTLTSDPLNQAEHGDDLALAGAMARAHNRAMLDFCAADKRLLATCYVPLADFELARAIAAEAIRDGASALLVASACPKRHGPSHIGLDPVWAQAQEAGLPIVFHVGGGGRLLDPMYFANGGPPVADFHGGAENFRSVDYMAIPIPPMQTLATMLFDGVLERFPRLKFGVIEQGASWLPGWMRQLDSALDAFGRHEERLQALSLRPSDYVRRQVRVTPYPVEDVGWIMREAGPETCLFSSDYPHVEGGRNPLKRFENSLAATDEADKRRFYCDNFVDLMGAGLS
ncbi:MAG: amidohydrolase family protein [Alphaproteobacteria bacterium]